MQYTPLLTCTLHHNKGTKGSKPIPDGVAAIKAGKLNAKHFSFGATYSTTVLPQAKRAGQSPDREGHARGHISAIGNKQDREEEEEQQTWHSLAPVAFPILLSCELMGFVRQWTNRTTANTQSQPHGHTSQKSD